MLEKIGLPSKPSMRGANWVPDASQCQGCSCQFTFINRKHHCRRCGGLFCGSCTQQKMTLRGQGDQPVRICDPCKKLEEATRFELRYGSKTRVGKGISKHVLKQEDEIIKQLLEDGESPSSSEQKLQSNIVCNQQTTRDASSSNLQQESYIPGDATYMSKDVIHLHDPGLNEIGSSSPEEMRRQAIEEKKKYRTLKGEKKPVEALAAFKRGKELEKLADTLELKIRKSRRLASVQKTNCQDNVTDGKKAPSRASKQQKDDLASELKELGWEDDDLHDTNKKPVTLSVEGELSNLIRETSQVSRVGKASSGIDKSQVFAHKKKALALKKQGNLAEAKEELKRAKILEKELEDQELLGADDESDDELSNLMRSLKDDKGGLTFVNNINDTNINFDQLTGLGDDFSLDVNFDVTDDDMNDPEIASALKSFGWDDGDLQLEGDVPAEHEKLEANMFSLENEAVGKKKAADKCNAISAEDRDKLKTEVLSLKKEAVNLRDAGKKAEAVSVFKRAKMIEKELESLQTKGQKLEPVSSETAYVGDFKQSQKTKIMIQKELLGSKKRLLALQKEGRVEEAEEELKKGKILEFQLEEMDSTMKGKNYLVESTIKPAYSHQDPSSTMDFSVAIDEANMTDEDMNDPELLAALENIEGNKVLEPTIKTVPVKTIASQAKDNRGPSSITKKQAISKTDIQRELLAIKRKAHALRRQGKFDEAEDELRKAKDLENQLAMSEVILPSKPGMSSDGSDHLVSAETNDFGIRKNVKHVPRNPYQEPSLNLDMLEDINEAEVTEQDMNDPALLSVLEELGWNKDATSTNTNMSSKLTHYADPSILSAKHVKNEFATKRELLNIKRKAFSLRRQGKFDEAEEELRMARNLENQLADASHPPFHTVLADALTNNHEIQKDMTLQEDLNPTDGNTDAIRVISSKPDSSRLPTKKEVKTKGQIQKDLLTIKRKAHTLRKQGKITEAEDELKNCKELEDQLAEMDVAKSHNVAQGSDDDIDLIIPNGSRNIFENVMRNDQEKSSFTGNACASGREVGNFPSQLPETVYHTIPATEALSLIENPNEEEYIVPFLDPGNAPTRVIHQNPQEDSIDFGTKFEQKRKSEENVALMPKSNTQSFSPMDLLTGDAMQKDNISPGFSSEFQMSALDSYRSSSSIGLAVHSNAPISSKGQMLNTNCSERHVNEGHHTDQFSSGEANFIKKTDSLKDQVLVRKRKAVAFKREGKLAEALEELRQAKVMEKTLLEENQQASQDCNTKETLSASSHRGVEGEKPPKIKLQSQKPPSGRDRFKMQQESLAHKRQAFKLRREGKMDEAEVETELAKKLEAQIEELDNHGSNSGKAKLKTEDDNLVEDLLDPQLMSALKAIGWQETDMVAAASSKPEIKQEVKQEPRKKTDMNTNVGTEKSQLQEQIKAEKLRALNLKHAGKQAEALEALRSAKRLEKKLVSLPS